MPRYFFHVHDHIDYPDTVGTVLADISAARDEAVVTAAAIIGELGPAFWEGDPWIMEVTDNDGHPLFRLTFSAKPG